MVRRIRFGKAELDMVASVAAIAQKELGILPIGRVGRLSMYLSFPVPVSDLQNLRVFSSVDRALHTCAAVLVYSLDSSIQLEMGRPTSGAQRAPDMARPGLLNRGICFRSF